MADKAPGTTLDAAPDDEALRDAVRDRYARAAVRHLPDADRVRAEQEAGCGCETGCCGGTTDPVDGDPITTDLYTGEFAAEAAEVSTGALAASLGCGNPHLLADLAPGETVLDLGSGGGLDVLLSARRVGPTGMAYGVDMTEEMLTLARRHQAEAGVPNAAFLRGTIEDLPLRDGLVDVVISNCVINLAADKEAVLAEAFRVTRPGGRFAVADVVLLRPIPESARRAMALWTGCISGALRDEEYLLLLGRTGWTDASVVVTRRYGREDLRSMAEAMPAEDLAGLGDLEALLDALDGAVAGAFVRARRPDPS